MQSVSVFGLGKLGLPLAASLANKGCKVTGVDLSQKVVETVNEGKSPYLEPGLADLVKAGHENLFATDDPHRAIADSEITFIVVPTPSNPDGSFSTKFAENAVASIGTALKSKSGYHLVILTSTVLPGDSTGVIIPIIEKTSGKKCGKGFGYCYSPEFIALGSVIRDFTNPDVVLIGESDPDSGARLESVYRVVCQNNPPIVRMGIYNAELAKISLNAYVTMKITFANTLAEIAEKIPGGDADAISKLLGFDTRIGRKYLSGGLAFGGPCFPRDNKAFSFVARRYGSEAKLSETTDNVNQHQIERIAGMVEQHLGRDKGKTVAFLGLTYKPNTDVVEESAAVKIANSLRKKGAKLSLHDPAGMENAKKILGDKDIKYAGSVGDCLQGADFCILTTPWNDYKSLKPEDFTAAMKKPVLLDCWRMFDRGEFSRKMKYISLGLNES